MAIERVKLAELLEQRTETEQFRDTELEHFVTIRMRGLGVVERSIGVGKTPRPFRGYRVRAGDFIYSRIDARNGAFGLVPAHLDRAVVSKDFPTFAIRADLVEPSYLNWMVTSESFWRQVQHLSFGATNRQRVEEATLGRLAIPLPPLPEQRRIASILDEARAVGRLADQQLESLSELRDSLIESAEASSDSIDRTVSSIIDRIDSGKSPVCEDREARESEWGVLKLGAISSGTYRPDGNTKALREDTAPLTRLEVKAGDVLLSRKNTPELVGASAYVRHTRSRLLLPDLIFRLVVNVDAGVIPAYLQAMLSAPRTRAKLRKIAGGSAASMSNISKARLSLITVPVASLRVQEELVSSLQQVVELTDAVMARKIMSEQLANALQTRAFKGEL